MLLSFFCSCDEADESCSKTIFVRMMNALMETQVLTTAFNNNLIEVIAFIRNLFLAFGIGLPKMFLQI